MARGITENDVFKACDALLLEGARPTIERVRQALGRGSPNTISPMLETWFKHLGARIKDPGAFSAPATVPDPVLQAAQHFWEVAQAEARRDVDERVRDGLAAAVANVEAEKERAAIAEAAAVWEGLRKRGGGGPSRKRRRSPPTPGRTTCRPSSTSCRLHLRASASSTPVPPPKAVPRASAATPCRPTFWPPSRLRSRSACVPTGRSRWPTSVPRGQSVVPPWKLTRSASFGSRRRRQPSRSQNASRQHSKPKLPRRASSMPRKT